MMLLQISRTNDMHLVGKVMRDPDVYPGISDDGSPPVADFTPVQHDSIWYALCRDGETTLGLFMFVPHGLACWEVHTCMLPAARGTLAYRAARETIEWIWKHTPCRRIFTNVPAFNKPAAMFARAAGLTYFGTNPSSFVKNGVLHDQLMFGVTKPEVAMTNRKVA